MKRAISLLTLLTAITLSSAAMAEPAYPTIALNSAEYGVGAVYMARSMITPSAVNPVTAAPYTEAEIAAVLAGESVAMPADAVVALSVCGADTLFFYDAEAAATILSHADPLTLNARTGEISTLAGEPVAAAK